MFRSMLLMETYRWNVKQTKMLASFNFRDLTNTKYYESANSSADVNPIYPICPATPLTATGSVPVEF